MSTINRVAYLARTAHDLDHVNRIGVPFYGVLELRLKASGKTSKSYLPEGAPAPAAAENGKDDFHFIPEKETVEILYDLEDRFGLIDEAKLELLTRFDETPLWSIDLHTLGEDWLAHGKHTIKWDGRIVKPAAEQKGTAKDDGFEHDLTKLDLDKSIETFADGYVTLEHTPYKFKLTVKSTSDEGIGNPLCAWTYWEILLKKIELELGDEATIPFTAKNDDEHKRNKEVYAAIAKDDVPKEGSTCKIFLLSNVFATASGEMYDSSGFNAYKDLWKDGPLIPIFAKIRLSDSNDAEVKLEESDKGAVALGKTKFLWEWKDPDEDVAAVQAAPKPKAFLQDAINYDKDKTGPKGDNCHVDRGGKRGPGAKPVFPEHAGYKAADEWEADNGKFPFKVEAASKRKWAALSQGWTSGKGKGKTGVVFQPSRMAGDDYTIVVYLANDKSKKDELTLDVDTQPLKTAEAIKKASAKFQIWREIHMSRYVRKAASVPQFFPADLGSVQGKFAQPYIDVKDKLSGGNSYTLNNHKLKSGAAPDYNQICKDLITAAGDDIFDYAVDAAADHAAVDAMFKTRNYFDFVRAAHGVHGAAGANDIADFAAELATSEDDAIRQLGATAFAGLTANPCNTRLEQTQVWLQNAGADTLENHARTLTDIFFGMTEDMAARFDFLSGGTPNAAPAGLATIHFNYTDTNIQDAIAAGESVWIWQGKATGAADADRNHCLVIFWFRDVDVFCHEVGHHAFLPHAKYPTAEPPDGVDESVHDDTDDGCLMSYSMVAPSFCGLCQLYLRGWDRSVLNKISANNKKV